MAAVLVLKVEAVKIEMTEKKEKRKNYQAMALFKIVALERGKQYLSCVWVYQVKFETQYILNCGG